MVAATINERPCRADNLRHLIAAYDLLAAQPGLNTPAIGTVGSSMARISARLRRRSVRSIGWR